jgi:hypothetical protein
MCCVVPTDISRPSTLLVHSTYGAAHSDGDLLSQLSGTHLILIHVCWQVQSGKCNLSVSQQVKKVYFATTSKKKSKVQVESNPKSRGDFFFQVGNAFWYCDFLYLWEVKKVQKEKTWFP